jgi:alcohol/geraniol dehydrogenase (NADP+)
VRTAVGSILALWLLSASIKVCVPLLWRSALYYVNGAVRLGGDGEVNLTSLSFWRVIIMPAHQQQSSAKTPETTGTQRPISALAAHAPGKRLQAYSYVPEALGALEVEVEISHCGVCHTDIHLIEGEPAGLSTFPLVPGHEIVGIVSARGRLVTHLRDGERVGVGPLAGACRLCDQCRAGRDQLCRQARYLPFGIPGGYASHIHVDSRCAFPLPPALASADAAPLLCAGVTVFAPLARHVGASAKIGIIGVGGLGHLALQYARALGCHVTAFSSSSVKRQDAERLGAHEFVDASDAEAINARVGTFDFLLATAAADLPWSSYVNALRPEGTLCVAGLPAHDVSVAAIPLIFGQRRVVGSLIGSTAESLTMLEFSARHGIRPQVEVCPMREANAALDKLRRNDVRYRMVLAN